MPSNEGNEFYRNLELLPAAFLIKFFNIVATSPQKYTYHA
ncbi:hypothetical protein SAMN05216327_1123 [Dyadobacter sp. SG02]|nr:hypothetical protein SAMN05216327_1123 [Dyadobacter sp. SG02]